MMSPVASDVEVFVDDVNSLHDESMSEEVNKSVEVCDVGVEKGSLDVVQKEVNGHGPALSSPLLSESQ
jgi:hypothetical protein